MSDHIADVSKMVDENPGVQGLAQLGRNAIDRVAQLEEELAGYVEANKWMQIELETAIEDARKYCEAQREIARLRDALQTVVDAADTAPPIKVIAYISLAVEKARAALAQDAEVPK